MTDTPDITNTINQLIQRMESAIDKLGPQAYEAAMRGMHFHAVFQIIAGCLCLAASGTLAWAFYKFNGKYNKSRDDFWVFCCILSGFVMVASGIAGAVCFLDPSSWIALFDPQAAFVYQLLHLGGGK